MPSSGRAKSFEPSSTHEPSSPKFRDALRTMANIRLNSSSAAPWRPKAYGPSLRSFRVNTGDFNLSVLLITARKLLRRIRHDSQPMFIIRHPRHRTGVHTDAVTISSGTPGPPIITAILDQPPGHGPLNKRLAPPGGRLKSAPWKGASSSR